MPKARDHSLNFFDAKFRRQIASADHGLNPFEQAVLPYLFGESELLAAFAGWKTEYARIETFPAPNDTVKRFCTVVMRRPAV